MATAKRCDRCGKFYEPGGGWNAKKHVRKSGVAETYFDLCDTCQDDLDKFMDGATVDAEYVLVCPPGSKTLVHRREELENKDGRS